MTKRKDDGDLAQNTNLISDIDLLIDTNPQLCQNLIDAINQLSDLIDRLEQLVEPPVVYTDEMNTNLSGQS